MFMFLNQHRLEDVRLILATAQKLDPHNGQFTDWLANVESGIAREETMTAQSRFNQAQQLVQAGKTAEAEALLDAAAQDPRASLNTLCLAAMGYAGVGKPGKGAAVMQKLTAANPEDWLLWFYLAQLQAVDGKAAEAAAALGRAFALNPSDRVTNQNQAPANFHDLVRQDKSFDRIRQTPEYQKAMGVKN
jgi:predicted Zn-dependent protease